MKNNLYKNLLIITCIFVITFILLNNNIIKNNIIEAVNLWITKVFPSLFPMFVINDLLLYANFPSLICTLFNKIFRIKGTWTYVFIMSILSGCPSNAIILKSLINENKISSEDAAKTLAFTYFSNPLFLWNILNNTFNYTCTLKIIIVHYLTNIIILFFFFKKLNNKTCINAIETPNIPLSNVINNSIKKNLDTLLMILGTITFYAIISTIVINCFSLSNVTQTIIKGFFEITQGLSSLANINIGIKLKEIIAITIISFGGLSIHSQVKNIISDTNIKYKYFLIGRIFHVLISVMLVFAF